ncbi:MAG: LysM peptidoglycan-binding domain-containing M23 family metallopeptidase, partial [Chloroflexaceae bacterium]|nr:LysM peptidoglycan-binding domain-containing M23 family metallopeptidase [Chloroflexaceae bacterium]
PLWSRGSEMCIRDSLYAGPSLPRRAVSTPPPGHGITQLTNRPTGGMLAPTSHGAMHWPFRKPWNWQVAAVGDPGASHFPSLRLRSGALPAVRRRGLRRRGALARAALARLRGEAVEVGRLAEPGREGPRMALRWPRGDLALRLWRHAWVTALVALVLAAELGGWRGAPAAGPRQALRDPQPLEGVVVAAGPLGAGPIALERRVEALTPPMQRPRLVPSAYQAIHYLEEGETLGAIAARYQARLEALVLANGLEQGDALVVGQALRIPRVSGFPHVVVAGETVFDLAARFGVPYEAIVAFPPHRIGASGGLIAGSEIFIPSERLELPEGWLRAVGGMEGLARRGPAPAAVVRTGPANLRAGPGTEYERVGQLAGGRRVALLGRHGDWVQVEHGGRRAWMRADLLELTAERLAAMPIANDVPPPPERWVWPARGRITSGFGPRWGGFHNGIDIANRARTPIVAARAGRVLEAGWCRGYGYCVRLGHAGGIETIYGHLLNRPVVAVGAEVGAGQ